MKRLVFLLNLVAILMFRPNQVSPKSSSSPIPLTFDRAPIVSREVSNDLSIEYAGFPAFLKFSPDTAGPALPDRLGLSSSDFFGAPSLVVPSWQDQLSKFVDAVADGTPGKVAGVFVPDRFSLPVLQQPAGQAAYVYERDDTVTQFSAAASHGAVGLLAHNFLSGQNFFSLKTGQEVVLVYGDRQLEYYRVSQIEQFQALSPEDPYSNFKDLADPDRKVLSSGDLFQQMYTSPDRLVFQTCIDAYGNPSWGRIFIIAERTDPSQAFNQSAISLN